VTVEAIPEEGTVRDRIRTHRTAITDVGTISGNRLTRKFMVEVVGFDGGGTFFRRTWEDAEACAKKYAAMFDAPREMFS